MADPHEPTIESAEDKDVKEKELQEHLLREHSGQESIPCKVCLKEVPKSLARTFEGEDYVSYFCGLDCLHEWEKDDKEST